MNTPFKFLLVAVMLSSILISPKVQADPSGDSEDEMNYEDIVRDLSKEEKRVVDSSSRAQIRATDSGKTLDDILIHAGVGVTQMFGTIAFAGGRTMYSQSGIQASLGIDLFSDNWLAEGTARNFSSSDYDSTAIALKEFDLKVVYHNRIAPKIGIRLGGGLAARYMHISEGGSATDYTTPASLFTGGIDLLAAKNLTVGAELGARTALVSDTVDKNSYDMTLRLDANF